MGIGEILIPITVAIIAAAIFFLGLPVFEVTFGIILIVPLLAFLAGHLVEPSLLVYVGGAAILLGVCYLFRDKNFKRDRAHLIAELLPIGSFVVGFIGFLTLCLMWPDFIAMGERLRDYAIISSLIQSPVEAKEPWMAGYAINYYVYWYRFGHLLSTVFGLQTWDVYHTLQSFTFAFYFAAIIRFFSRYLSFSPASAIFCGLLITLGSNVDGLLLSLEPKDAWGNWWRPSRVIKGAINEFPAWSFLLGDAHPHYLNLGGVPYLLCVVSALLTGIRSDIRILAAAIVGLIVGPLFLFSANAWEVPFWAGIVTCIALVWLTLTPWERIKSFPKEFLSFCKKLNINKRAVALVVSSAALSLVLYLSFKHINPGKDPLTLVRAPIENSQISEMFNHWGFPLTLIALGTVACMRTLNLAVFCAAVLIPSLLFNDASVFLYALLIMTGVRLFEGNESDRLSRRGLFIAEGLGIASIGLLLLPEVVFINDAYGGENERMNTIFKVYALNWFPLHAYAMFLVSEAFGRISPLIRKNFPIWLPQVVCLAFFLKFTYQTARFERWMKDTPVMPREQGLSAIDREFPGAAATIKALEKLPKGIVLEGQDNPYSYTSHVSTLSGNSAFLGWSNHVSLLLRAYDEIKRRETVTRDIYETLPCEEKREATARENIMYVVIGPIEKKKYPGLSDSEFSCMKELMSYGGYKVLLP